MQHVKHDESNNVLLVQCSPNYTNHMAAMGAAWNPYQRQWVLPYTASAEKSLNNLFAEAAKTQADNEPIKINANDYGDWPQHVKTRLYEHQLKAYNAAIKHNCFGLFHEQGCGKTITTIAVMGNRFLNGQIKRAIIICPVVMLRTWANEIEKFADYNTNVTIITGSAERKKRLLQTAKSKHALDIVIINYESAWRLSGLLVEYNPDMIICDESQKIKTHDSQQSRGLHQLGTIPRYKMILTGTPINNSPLDIWSQYRFLEPNIFQNNYFAFRGRYGIMGGFNNKQVVAYKNLDELHDKIYSIADRVTKAEALDLPEESDQFLYVDFEPKGMKTYKTIEKQSMSEIDKYMTKADKSQSAGVMSTPYVMTRIIRLHQLCGGFAKTDDDKTLTISTRKLSALYDIVEDLTDAGQKVVIMARYINEIAAIKKLLAAKYGNSAVRVLWGKSTTEERSTVQSDFQDNPDVKIFIGQIQCAGVGLTLHAASTMIFYSMDYSNENHAQARARIHRIGQTNKCTYIYLFVNGTIDNHIYNAVVKKADLAAYVVDKVKNAEYDN